MAETGTKNLPSTTGIPELQFDIYDQAWDALTEKEQAWLGREDFDTLCEASASGTKDRKLHDVLWVTREEFRTDNLYPRRRLAFTVWMRKLVRRGPVREYIEAMKENAVPSWRETVRELRKNSQQVVRDKLQTAVNNGDPDREALSLAKWVAEYEMGKPEQRSRVTQDVSGNAIAAFDRASGRVAEALSHIATSRREAITVVDSEANPVGSSEPEA